MSAEPSISVIVPWHGNFEHLRRAIRSLRAQTKRPYEIVVIANGPALALIDATVQSGEFADCRFCPSIIGDASRARNAGIEAAHGDWLAFLDVDDEFLPDKLQRLSDEIRKNRADIIISRGLRVRSTSLSALYPPQLLGDGEDLGEFFFSRGANCSASAIVIRRSLAQKIRFIDDLKKFEDNDFLIRAHHAGGRVSMIAEPLYLWHDSTELGRLSLGADYASQLAWVSDLRPILGERAYFGFLARRIGQHRFPRHFLSAGGMIWTGWRRGGIPLKETLLFALRGLLPHSLARTLIDIKTRRDGKQAASAARTTANA